MLEKILRSTFRTTIKQIKQVRRHFFSNEELEKYEEDLTCNYELAISSDKIKEYFYFIKEEKELEVKIITPCDKNIKKAFVEKVMAFYHIIYADKLETELYAREYFTKIFHENEKITFHQRNFKYQLKDNKIDFSCKVAWAEFRYYQLEAFYTKGNKTYKKEYEELRKQYKNETIQFLKKFQQIEEKQRIRKLMKMI